MRCGRLPADAAGAGLWVAAVPTTAGERGVSERWPLLSPTSFRVQKSSAPNRNAREGRVTDAKADAERALTPILTRMAAPTAREAAAPAPPAAANSDDDSEPPTLLSLTTELLILIVEFLPPVSICRFGLVSHFAQGVAHADELWSVKIDEIWSDAQPQKLQQASTPDAAKRIRGALGSLFGITSQQVSSSGSGERHYSISNIGISKVSAMQQFAALSYSRYPEVLPWKEEAKNSSRFWIRFGQPSRVHASATTCAWSMCGGSLLWDSTPPRRCICVPTRCKLPLRIASLSLERAGSSSFEAGGFDYMLQTLRACYDLKPVRSQAATELGVDIKVSVSGHGVTVAELRPELLAQLDVLVLCTTEGPPLGESELAALRSWVEAGGALVVSAFANWTAHNHFAAQTVGWLGLQTIPRAIFGRPTASPFEPHARALGRSRTRTARAWRASLPRQRTRRPQRCSTSAASAWTARRRASSTAARRPSTCSTPPSKPAPSSSSSTRASSARPCCRSAWPSSSSTHHDRRPRAASRGGGGCSSARTITGAPTPPTGWAASSSRVPICPCCTISSPAPWLRDPHAQMNDMTTNE